MNIYKCTQIKNRGWDTYDSFVCYANSEHEAKNTMPDIEVNKSNGYASWCSPEYVTAELIGTCENVEAGVILSSYNAG